MYNCSKFVFPNEKNGIIQCLVRIGLQKNKYDKAASQ